ncbi:polysaccharide biosynthesis protein [Gaetbulibacter aquiaggeris]|uniref:Polysaccharide biosynthesis protein n=1 Tax=Gaetbulibacter aquiaggeris TaxID=1735373 RepID=A0ABW7MVU4_9FLAO
MDKDISNHIRKLLEDGSLVTKDNNDLLSVHFDFSEDTILITGAAGTIGSGLTKLILNCPFKSLILLDNAESPLYYLQKELEAHETPNVHFVLTDIRDEASMLELFSEFKPSLIFHTAAYKHVPMMEANPYEAVKLNILATKFLADLALINKTKKFVFISTDKAVNPISIMGLTKCICERYLMELNSKNSTKFLIARFGNIIGSNGSLIPLFKKQLELGRPLSVTSPEVTRYFINKLKACQHILQISNEAHWKHALFTFNMGKPIKIIDLATCYLEFSGYDIQNNIEFIGLRPGEKLHEDMISESEALKSTPYKDILYVLQKTQNKQNSLDLEPIKSITPNDKTYRIKAILNTILK